MPEGRRTVGRWASTSLAAAMLIVLAGCGGSDPARLTSGVTDNNPDGMHGAVLAKQYVVPDVTLTATDGTPYSLTKDTTAPLTLVFFGYTHCPDICQVVMADIASAMTRLDPGDRKKVDVLFVTSDPARDDPKTLREYLERFNPDFEGVTGDLKTIVEAGNALGVPIEKGAKLPSGGYEVTHGTQIVAIDNRDRAPIVWTEGTPATQLAEDLEALLHQRESSPAS
ncbi:MAG TPA: SCO family protein [Nocardioidaceae bacterium]|nr:SCO family protein [Nocardioidaceae bacterium]